MAAFSEMAITAPRPLRLSGVSVYAAADTEKPVCLIEDADLTVRPGEWVNLAGVNGSGKSTLARLLAGLHMEGVYGRIDLGFAEKLPSPIVFQRPESQLFGETPREEALFALEWRGVSPDKMEELAGEALRRAGLLALADRPWEELSGGQRQMAAVAAACASAWAGGCGLIVFDEATSMLDDAHRHAVIGSARELWRQGVAVIWVTQRLDELEADDRIVALKNGRILYDGDVRSFFHEIMPDGQTPCEACGLRAPPGAAPGRRTDGFSFMNRAERQNGNGRRQRESFGTEEGLVIEGLRFEDLRRRSAGETGTAVRNLTLFPGTLTLVLGPNGAGKTAFLEKLAGLRDPEGLAVRFREGPLWLPKRIGSGRRLNPRALLAYGYASQAPEEGLAMRSLKKELEYSLRPFMGKMDPESGKMRMRHALAAVGWDESWLTRDPHLLSGGERRRAALAALFVTPAPWLLLDEPTAGLDREGQELLASQLVRLRDEGRGIVLVSHETDWALPLADQVLLLHPDGRMRLCEPDQLISRHELWAEAGLTVPAWLKERDDSGQTFPGQPETPPEGMATEAGRHPREAETAQTGHPPRKPHAYRAPHPLERFDPRSVWLGYILLSAGIFTLTTWSGLFAAAAVVLALMALGRIPLMRWKGLLAGFVMFGAGFAAMNALRFDAGAAGMTWDTGIFLQTLFPFARTMTVLLAGLGLPLVWSPLKVRKALEQMAARKGKVPAFWQSIVLILTLTLRFVPVLLREWERFGRIALARGKETRKTPAAILRKLRDTLLPLLHSLIRLADETAAALESRGVRRGAERHIRARLRWAWRDYAVAVLCALLAACFVMMK